MAKKPNKEAREKQFDDQFDDEEVLFVFRKHPFVMRRGFVLGSLGLLVGPLFTLILTYVNTDNPPSLGFFYVSLLVSAILAGILFMPSWINWYYSVFIVTNQRLIQITRKGFFSKTVVDLSLNHIQSLNYEVKGIQATLLGFGSIMVQTYMGDLVVHEIHHPARIAKELALVLRNEGIEPVDLSNQEEEGNEKIFKEI